MIWLQQIYLNFWLVWLVERGLRLYKVLSVYREAVYDDTHCELKGADMLGKRSRKISLLAVEFFFLNIFFP